MCLFGGGAVQDNSAELARQQEAERQARIAQGRTAIDDAFGSAFNDQYFDDYQGQYTGFYMPKLEDQYNDANRRLTLQLASNGGLRSSAGIRALGDLADYFNDQKIDMTNKSVSALSDHRSEIERAKDSLYSQNIAAADPGNASAGAASRVESLLTPPDLDPLPDVFSNFFANLNNAQLVNSRVSPSRTNGVQVFNSGGGGGSSFTVG